MNGAWPDDLCMHLELKDTIFCHFISSISSHLSAEFKMLLNFYIFRTLPSGI